MFIAEERKKLKKQFTLEYAFYMILSSYFKEVVVKTTFTEAQLALYYRELPKEKQYTLEDRLIIKIEEEVLKELPEDIERLKAEIFIFTTKDRECHTMRINLGWIAYDIRVSEEYNKVKKKPELKIIISRRTILNE